MSVQTLSELFLVAAGHAKPDAMLEKVDGEYRAISSSAMDESVRRIAAALQEMGVRRGDRVALMADNGSHWPIVDFATLGLGAILVPIYPTLTPEQAAYIARDCGATVCFVQGYDRLEGMLAERESMPEVNSWVMIADGDPPDTSLATYGSLLHETVAMSRPDFEDSARQVAPDDLATFIYTSGTTGNPKGVMLTHANIASNVIASLQVLDIEGSFTALSFLPLSHSFERMVDYIYFYRGVSIAYAESVQAVAQNMLEVRPHVFVSVPRVYEKILGKVLESVNSGSELKQRIFNWARDVAQDALAHRLELREPNGLLGMQLALADRLVFAKLRDRLGGRFRFAISGGAPLPTDVAKFFWGAGIAIYEGYGLSETSPVLTANTPDAVRLGTVGTAIPGVELMIADDGEILARGPNIMQGYFDMPEETAETIDANGWFHTGDIGEIDPDGFLKITDRKKEIIVNAYGKNVAPAPIENALKSSRFISQAVVIGDRRKLLAALLVPDFEALDGWADRIGIEVDEISDFLGEEAVQELFETELEQINNSLARYEQIRIWALLPAEFTIETGELTPTQKIKRRVINDKYGELVDGLYRESGAD